MSHRRNHSRERQGDRPIFTGAVPLTFDWIARAFLDFAVKMRQSPARERLRRRQQAAVIGIVFMIGLLCNESFGLDDLAAIRETVKRSEAEFERFSAEISEFCWDTSRTDELVSTASKRVVQWQDSIYESEFSNDLRTKNGKAGFRLLWCDGTTLTVFRSPNQVDQYFGRFQTPPQFQAYSILLEELGYHRPLSQFLAGECGTPFPMQIEMLSEGEFGGLHTLGIRGTRRFPGSPFASIIELHLAIDFGYLPCWGKLTEVDANEHRENVETRASSFSRLKDGLWLMREISVKSPIARDNSPLCLVKLLRISGAILHQRPSDDLFRSSEFVGNPTIRTHKNLELKEERRYIPPAVKKEEPWPPYVTWLVINDVIAGFIGLAYLMSRLSVAIKIQPQSRGTG